MVCWAISHFWVFVFNPYGFFISSTRAVNSFFLFFVLIVSNSVWGCLQCKKKGVEEQAEGRGEAPKRGGESKAGTFCLTMLLFFLLVIDWWRNSRWIHILRIVNWHIELWMFKFMLDSSTIIHSGQFVLTLIWSQIFVLTLSAVKSALYHFRMENTDGQFMTYYVGLIITWILTFNRHHLFSLV